jgi:cell division protein FtsW
MAKRVSVDRWLFTVTMLLVFVGLVMVFSASAVMARERFGSPYAFLSKQLIWAVAGLVAMVVAMRLDYRRYKHPALVFSLMGFTTLLLISVFFLDRSHNTHRWIHAGGFSFQPSELAKPVLILFLAYFLESRSKTIDDVRNTLLPAAAPVLVFLGLIVLEPDLGTAIACAGITACVLYVAGMRMRYFAYAFGASLLPLYLLIFHVSWRRDRILAFLNPYADRQGTGFHIIQSLIAVGTGGVTGTGLMEGKQKLFYLPEPHTDFIFAVTAEELGLLAHRRRLRPPLGGGNHQHGRAAGIHQHQRGAGHDAHERHSPATGLIWRFLVVRDAGMRRCAVEYHQAVGVTTAIVDC